VREKGEKESGSEKVDRERERRGMRKVDRQKRKQT